MSNIYFLKRILKNINIPREIKYIKKSYQFITKIETNFEFKDKLNFYKKRIEKLKNKVKNKYILCWNNEVSLEYKRILNKRYDKINKINKHYYNDNEIYDIIINRVNRIRNYPILSYL